MFPIISVFSEFISVLVVGWSVDWALWAVNDITFHSTDMWVISEIKGEGKRFFTWQPLLIYCTVTRDDVTGWNDK